MKKKQQASASRVLPGVSVLNRQRTMRVPQTALELFAQRALRECLRLPTKRVSVLARLTEVSVVLVSDRRMAELHRRFLHLPGPTDVITFQHGEIFVSVETARRQARRFETSFASELRLYIVHGFLHLHGFDDKDAAEASRMKRTQEKLVASVSGASLG